MGCQSVLPGCVSYLVAESCYVSVSVWLFSSWSHVNWEKSVERTHELVNKLNWRLMDRETKRQLRDKLTDRLDWKRGHRGVTGWQTDGVWQAKAGVWQRTPSDIRPQLWRLMDRRLSQQVKVGKGDWHEESYLRGLEVLTFACVCVCVCVRHVHQRGAERKEGILN